MSLSRKIRNRAKTCSGFLKDRTVRAINRTKSILNFYKLEGFCPYRTDFPWRIIIFVSALLNCLSYWFTRVSTDSGITSVNRKIRAYKLVVSTFLVYHAVIIFSCYFNKTLLPFDSSVDIPLIKDYAFLLALPSVLVLIVVVFRFYEGILPTLNELKSQRILVEKRHGGYQRFIEHLDRQYNNKFVIPFFIIGATTLILGPTTENAWNNPRYQFTYIYSVLWAFLVWFSLFYFAWKCVITWLAVRRVAKGREDLRFSLDEFHYDKCCGLSLVTNLWMHINYVIVVLGLYLLSFPLLTSIGWPNPSIICRLILYIVVTPLVFSGPIISMHLAMLRFKKVRLEKVSAEIKKVTEKIEQTIGLSRQDNADHRDVPILISQERFLRSRYETVQKLRVWPFDVSIFRRFSGSYLLPIAVYVLQAIIMNRLV